MRAVVFKCHRSSYSHCWREIPANAAHVSKEEKREGEMAEGDISVCTITVPYIVTTNLHQIIYKKGVPSVDALGVCAVVIVNSPSNENVLFLFLRIL